MDKLSLFTMKARGNKYICSVSRYIYKNCLHSQFSINHVIDEWKEKITKTEWRVYIYPYVYSFCQTSKSQQKNQLSSSKTRKSLLSLEKKSMKGRTTLSSILKKGKASCVILGRQAGGRRFKSGINSETNDAANQSYMGSLESPTLNIYLINSEIRVFH